MPRRMTWGGQNSESEQFNYTTSHGINFMILLSYTPPEIRNLWPQ